MRADARRNREKVLRAAYEAFASEGRGVSVQEIARRAGVGTGTVSRHFPTKEALYEAIVLDRMEVLAGAAEGFAAERGPGEAFSAFLGFMVDEGALDHGLADALSGDGFDVVAAARGTGHDVVEVLGALLARAQEAGEVRGDVDAADVKALVSGCIARGRGGADEAARRRTVAVVLDGLRPRA
ncbi:MULTISPECIES: TetR/AcrR family transcriptional regulator [Nocardiopsis]|uniref:AcrR family transcriptional regulator n=1 Tax=Nocardiopsis sinuspersici TaxID=501010 RepID=A0A1V3C3R7_9ACTN|nr:MULTISPECIES: TetR/AcrR family transcriptional regulator [Nocardiopsis]NYH51249.1 AcrR family transcriptional regulator [Nocardiopsis sinuspersici]OOC55020.1 TetR family transcriptional regulator [Nocardiopsis sinuspersici]